MAKRLSVPVHPRQLKISRNAYRNMLDITHYIAVDQQAMLNAQKVSDKIFASITRIGENPLAAKECEYIPTKTKMYRQRTCLSWMIFYKVNATEILILGVLHQANNPSKFKALKKVK